jgi:erythromycin esterase-like protein
VIDQLVELRRKYRKLMSRDGHIGEEEFFSAEQNARLVMNAERYYRAMFHGRDESWNLRDTHMLETLNELAAHLDRGRAKVVVWAHNSHLGNARATEMSERGELNVGQLVRERPALRGSYEERFHAVELPRFWLNLRERNDATKLLRERRLQRAIGVIYRPDRTLEPLFCGVPAGAVRRTHSPR